MSDNMSQENESTIKDDEIQNEVKKKQFYSINLTSERVFLIFVLIIAIIAVVVVAVVFSTSSKSVTKNKDVASEEVIDEIVNSDDFAFFDDENTVELLDTEEISVSEETPALAPEKITISDSSEKENTKNAVKTEETAAVAKPEVKINDKVSYSSSYSEKTEAPSTPQPVQKSAAVTKIPTEKQVSKQAVQEKKWIIQIGSFTSKKSADNVADFYKKDNYPAYVKEFMKDGKTYYRLRIGPYDSDVKAQEALVKIKTSKYGKDSFVSVGYF